MKKYQVYRSLVKLDKDVKKHELIAVEYGKDIYAVTDALINAVRNDAIGLEKYQKFYDAQVYEPEPVDGQVRVKRYAYVMMAVLAPEYGEKNDIIDYGITEETGED